MSWLPNALTISRCLLAGIIAALVLRLGAAEPPAITAMAPFILFCVVALTDFLDGYLARRLDAVTSFGMFLDPIADKLLVALCLLASCAVSGWPLVLAVPTGLIILRDIGVTLARLQPGRHIPVSRLAKVKTATELVGIGGLLLAVALAGNADEARGTVLVSLAVFALLVAAILSGWTAAQYFRRG